MILRTYFLIGLSTGSIWAGIALIIGASPVWALVVFTLAFPMAFFALMFVGGAAKLNEKPPYRVNQDLE